MDNRPRHGASALAPYRRMHTLDDLQVPASADDLDRLCHLIDQADYGSPWAHFLYNKADALVCELTKAGVLTSHLEPTGQW